jgi:hypothetical protein
MIDRIARPRHGYDDVLSVYEYHDGPRKGIANFHGVPHYFECVFDDKSDEYSDRYLLTRLDQQALKAGMENWEIFLRWRTAFDSGKAGRETHPALPPDKNQYDETRRTLDNALASSEGKRIRAKGEFEVSGDSTLPRDVLTRWQVKWIAAKG